MEEFFIGLGAVWLLSPLVLLIALIVARRKLKRLQRDAAITDDAETLIGDSFQLTPDDLDRLLLLQLELRHQLKEKALTETEYAGLIGYLEILWSRHLTQSGLTPEAPTWQRERDQAWRLLAHYGGISEPPPWQSPSPIEKPVVAKPQAEPQLETTTALPEPQPTPPPVQEPSAPALLQKASPPSHQIADAETAAPPATPLPDDDFDWAPAPPSPVEQWVQTLSGWSKLAAPFLMQNIGWFIGGFCFVAGTLFLVSYTSGFINALVIFLSLLAYTGFLLWGGYQLRRRRAELRLSSTMLMSIGMLLAPLNITAVTRLLIVAAPSLGLQLVALAAAAVSLLAFYWAANLVGGLMDRSLQGRHPRLLLILVGLQLSAPLLAEVTHWGWLAGLHGLLLMLVGGGLVLFVRDWVRSIFVDQRRIAYYAGGLLVYSALVSFAHLTWAFPGRLPTGYYGPFLMALCGLLFYADAALKVWAKRYAFLSRFTFGLYGLSVLAVVLCIQAPMPRLLTLALGAGIYGLMVWKYLTLIPLYLLLACLGALYGLLILTRVPDAAYLLASLPGLAGLLLLLRWSRTRSQTMAGICFAAFGLSMAGLAAWSLFHAEPGWLGMSTAFTASVVSYYALRLLPDEGLEEAGYLPLTGLVLRLGASLYPVTILAALTLAYAPRWPILSWEMQFAFGLVGLAALWAWLGLVSSRTLFYAEAWLNSALLSLGLALAVALWSVQPAILYTPVLSVLLAAAAGVLLWLSLGLRLRGLFYAALLCLGLAGMIIKRSYFPAPSSGLMYMLLAVIMWGLIRWLDRVPEDLAAVAAVERPRLTVLWRFSAFRAGLRS